MALAICQTGCHLQTSDIGLQWFDLSYCKLMDCMKMCVWQKLPEGHL